MERGINEEIICKDWVVLGKRCFKSGERNKDIEKLERNKNCILLEWPNDKQ